MRILIAFVVIAIAGATFSPGYSFAAEEQEQVQQSRVALDELLDTVSRNSGEQFLVHANVRPDVVVGPMRTRDVSLTTLHTVLRNNGLAAVRAEGVISIIPVATVRQNPLRVVTADDDSIPADEWVLRSVRTKNGPPMQLVALMRPLVPQAGHLVAHASSSTLTIVAPYGVATHVVRLVEEMDRHSTAQE